jgi:hypothetical protein
MVSIFLYNSCDILRLSQFKVEAWTPGNGYHSEPEKIIISLSFSHDPDRSSIEKNFSLTGEGNRIKGNFFWENKKLIFSPLTPLEINTDYNINLSADAHDTEGLSMDEAFNCNFTTRPDNVRPILISCSPAMYAEVNDLRTKIMLEFSAPVPTKTLYDNISFNPSMSGFWFLENEGKLAVFTPVEPWMQKSRYEMRLSSSLTGVNGMNIGNEFLSIFTTETDHEIPYLVNSCRITNNDELILLATDKGYLGAAESPVENMDWEKDDKILLVFSEPVDSVTVKNYFSAEDGPSLIMETTPGFNTEYIFRFENAPVYESRFTLRIKSGIRDNTGNESKEEYIFRVFVNGKFSKPPELFGIRIPMSPGNETEQNPEIYTVDSLFEIIPITNEDYPSGESVKTWIELYFITAENVEIDLFSIMELFRIETTNNVITFSPQQVKNTDFTITEPHSEWENLQRIEINGNLINSTNFGIIIFQITAGLRDSLGNRNEKSFRISLTK